jgi:hypothetical protein
MSTIVERLKQTDAAMKVVANKAQLGLRLKQAAIAALMGGIESDAWKSYMSLFANNQEQLNRLTVKAEDEDWTVTESRAYIVANAICGADSTTQTSLKVQGVIDADLEAGGANNILDPDQPVPEGAIATVRPFKIPG